MSGPLIDEAVWFKHYARLYKSPYGINRKAFCVSVFVRLILSKDLFRLAKGIRFYTRCAAALAEVLGMHLQRFAERLRFNAVFTAVVADVERGDLRGGVADTGFTAGNFAAFITLVG